MKKFLRKYLLVVTLLSSSLVTSCYKESEQKAEEKKEEPKPTEQPSTPTPSQPQKVVVSYVDRSETKTVEDLVLEEDHQFFYKFFLYILILISHLIHNFLQIQKNFLIFFS